jgi:hypothetical protein
MKPVSVGSRASSEDRTTSIVQHLNWIREINYIGLVSAALTLAQLLLLTGIAARSAAAQNFQVLQSFTGQADGAEPFATLIKGSGGDLYGTTAYGGNLNDQMSDRYWGGAHGFQTYFCAYDSSNFFLGAGFTSTSCTALLDTSGGA